MIRLVFLFLIAMFLPISAYSQEADNPDDKHAGVIIRQQEAEVFFLEGRVLFIDVDENKIGVESSESQAWGSQFSEFILSQDTIILKQKEAVSLSSIEISDIVFVEYKFNQNEELVATRIELR